MRHEPLTALMIPMVAFDAGILRAADGERQVAGAGAALAAGTGDPAAAFDAQHREIGARRRCRPGSPRRSTPSGRVTVISSSRRMVCSAVTMTPGPPENAARRESRPRMHRYHRLRRPFHHAAPIHSKARPIRLPFEVLLMISG